MSASTLRTHAPVKRPKLVCHISLHCRFSFCSSLFHHHHRYPPASSMGNNKSREEKKERKKQKVKAAAALALKAPPRTVPPLRVNAPAEAPQASTSTITNSVSGTSLDRPSGAQIQDSDNVPPSTSTHTAEAQLDSTQTNGKRARSPEPEHDRHLRKREKKLLKIIELMEHDISSSR